MMNHRRCNLGRRGMAGRLAGRRADQIFRVLLHGSSTGQQLCGSVAYLCDFREPVGLRMVERGCLYMCINARIASKRHELK